MDRYPPPEDRMCADAPGAELEIIETLCVENGVASRLMRHLARMAGTAARLGFAFDLDAAQAALAALPPGMWRARLGLSQNGLRVDHAPMPAPLVVFRLAVSPVRLRADDPWLQVKTTNRAVYDTARASLPAGADEVIFLNERGEVCEGTITNIFAQIDGRLLTPPLSCGLLPGVLRAELLDIGQAHEAVLRPADLHGSEQVFVGNSLRGLCRATPPASG